jgi:hypothetical protein
VTREPLANGYARLAESRMSSHGINPARACRSIWQERHARHPAAPLTTDVIRLPRKPQMKLCKYSIQRFVHLRKWNAVRHKLKNVSPAAEFAINLVRERAAHGINGSQEERSTVIALSLSRLADRRARLQIRLPEVSRIFRSTSRLAIFSSCSGRRASCTVNLPRRLRCRADRQFLKAWIVA